MVASSAAMIADGAGVPDGAALRSHVRRRRISPQAGHALEILGHAIEYLTDEYVHDAGTLSVRDGQLQTVQLLMCLNRQIYFDCPEVPTFAERWRALLDAHAA